MDGGPEGGPRLSRLECLSLLGRASVGRVAFSHRAMPAIVPVTFAMVRDHLVVAADDRALLAYARDGAVVALQTDQDDHLADAVWSVTCVGRAHRLALDDADRRLAGVTPLPGTTERQFLRIDADLLDGRRFLRRPLAAREFPVSW
ncbi:pyridoxamine 5'-phosphate oxidase family protein [Acidothermaceae bacterium B102]|nr:pyridoxamine 5'-phosphate oxidase family protein [Acidothermaceae bacterium B102]